MAWITNNVIGFFVSYLVGFIPSKTPPWGGARLSLPVAEALADTIRVTVSMTVTVAEAMVVDENAGLRIRGDRGEVAI